MITSIFCMSLFQILLMREKREIEKVEEKRKKRVKEREKVWVGSIV